MTVRRPRTTGAPMADEAQALVGAVTHGRRHARPGSGSPRRCWAAGSRPGPVDCPSRDRSLAPRRPRCPRLRMPSTGVRRSSRAAAAASAGPRRCCSRGSARGCCVAGRTQDSLDETVRSPPRRASPRRSTRPPCDVREPEQVDAMLDAVARRPRARRHPAQQRRRAVRLARRSSCPTRVSGLSPGSTSTPRGTSPRGSPSGRCCRPATARSSASPCRRTAAPRAWPTRPPRGPPSSRSPARSPSSGGRAACAWCAVAPGFVHTEAIAKYGIDPECSAASCRCPACRRPTRSRRSWASSPGRRATTSPAPRSRPTVASTWSAGHPRRGRRADDR